jgi:hypothetical protein
MTSSNFAQSRVEVFAPILGRYVRINFGESTLGSNELKNSAMMPPLGSNSDNAHAHRTQWHPSAETGTNKTILATVSTRSGIGFDVVTLGGSNQVHPIGLGEEYVLAGQTFVSHNGLSSSATTAVGITHTERQYAPAQPSIPPDLIETISGIAREHMSLRRQISALRAQLYTIIAVISIGFALAITIEIVTLRSHM